MIRRWLPGLVLAALALTSAWYLHRLDGDQDTGGQQARHVPDFYMEDFATVSMGVDGRPERELRAARLVHYADTDTNELTEPHLLLYRDQGEPMQVIAERGWLSADRDVALLHGRVHIWQDAQDGARRLEVITRDLRVLLNKAYAETDKPAVIRAPWGEARGVGMRVYMQEDRLELLSQVQTIYDPSKAQ